MVPASLCAWSSLPGQETDDYAADCRSSSSSSDHICVCCPKWPLRKNQKLSLPGRGWGRGAGTWAQPCIWSRGAGIQRLGSPCRSHPAPLDMTLPGLILPVHFTLRLFLYIHTVPSPLSSVCLLSGEWEEEVSLPSDNCLGSRVLGRFDIRVIHTCVVVPLLNIEVLLCLLVNS